LYDLADKTFFVNRDVSFRESTFPFQTLAQSALDISSTDSPTSIDSPLDDHALVGTPAQLVPEVVETVPLDAMQNDSLV